MIKRVEDIKVEIFENSNIVKVVDILQQCTNEELETLFFEFFEDEDILNMLDRESIEDYIRRKFLTK
jgi:hypothetical protein